MGKPKVSLGCLVVITACVAVACGVGALLYHWRMTWNIVPSASWPSELQTLIADLRHEGVEVTDVEVRSVGLITTYCWRMAATDRIVAAHVDCFHLVPVPNDGIETNRIHERFPFAWTWPQQKGCECFAYPPGLPGAKEGEFEFVLVHDKPAKQLFFFYYFNF